MKTPPLLLLRRLLFEIRHDPLSMALLIIFALVVVVLRLVS